MKELIIVVLLAGCSSKKCPTFKYRDYLYGDKVTKIYTPFYKGVAGTIISRSSRYEDSCVIPSFIVRIDKYKGLPEKELNMSQFALFVD